MAGRNKIEVAILADTSGYQRGLRSAGAETESFGSRVGGVAKIGMLGFAGALVGVGAALGESVKAAMGAQASQASLDAALKATHQSVTAMTPALEDAASSARKMGFTDEDAEKALARLELATGDTKKAVADLSVAQDIARTKHIDLVTASGMLAQAMTGSQRAAKQLGIIVSPVTKNLDALKAAHVDLTTASGKALEAHAKLLDKMATGNAVIAATRDRVKGQAQAFSETAAGAMAQFHAQLENLEVTLGTALLPALTRVTKALADGIAWLQQSKTAHEAVADAGKGLAVVFHLIGDAIDWVRAHWTEISADATKAMDTVKAVVSGAVTVVLAVWHEFGGTILSFMKATWENVKQVVVGAFNVIEGIFRLFADVIHGRWGKAWDDVKQIVSGAWNVIEGLLSQAVNQALTIATLIGKAIWTGIKHGVEALAQLEVVLLVKIGQAVDSLVIWAAIEAAKIGEGIVNGILGGIGSLASSLGHALTHAVGSAIGGVKSAFGISSPSKVTHDQVGVPLAQGVIEGFIVGSASLPDKMSATIRNGIEAARTAITSSRGIFGSAWQQLTQDALAAFDAATARMMGKLEAQRGAMTASEKKLQDLQNAHDETGRQKAIAAAQAGVAAANAAVAAAQAAAAAGMTPADQQALADAQTKVALAQERVNAAVAKYGADSSQAAQATLALHSAQNELQSKTDKIGGQAGQDLKAAQDQQVAAQQALDDALYNEQVANLEKQAATERAAKDKQYAAREKERQARRDLERRHFEQHLATLEARLEREGASHRVAQAKIIALLKSYGVNYEQAGKDLGLAFAQGLQESAGAVEKSAAALAAIVAKYLKTNSPSELGPMSDLPSWWKGFAPALASGLDTRFITQTVNTAASPSAPARIGGFAGGGDVHIHVGTVIGTSLEKATDEIYAQLLRKQGRNGSLHFR